MNFYTSSVWNSVEIFYHFSEHNTKHFSFFLSFFFCMLWVSSQHKKKRIESLIFFLFHTPHTISYDIKNELIDLSKTFDKLASVTAPYSNNANTASRRMDAISACSSCRSAYNAAPDVADGDDDVDALVIVKWCCRWYLRRNVSLLDRYANASQSSSCTTW